MWEGLVGDVRDTNIYLTLLTSQEGVVDLAKKCDERRALKKLNA